MIQEVYLESGLEEESVVRQQRDERYAQLQAQGWDCRREDLYTVDGRRVFVVVAAPHEEEPSVPRRVEGGKPRPRADRRERLEAAAADSPLGSTRPRRRVAGYEER